MPFTLAAVGHGRRVIERQPLVFHCNHYNYWLQKVLLLDESLGMDAVIRDAAAEVAADLLANHPGDPAAKLADAADAFRLLGFGTIDFSLLTAAGGEVRTPTSHYGQLLKAAVAGQAFGVAQNLFDQGFAAGVAFAAFGLPFAVTDNECMSTGAPVGRFQLKPGGDAPRASVGVGRQSPVSPPPPASSHVDEPAVLNALAGLDLSGNEEGFIPRFGVALTHHFANFYNRISFEFVRAMSGSGLLEDAEELLVNAGYQCAFNTFGGIMLSGEWRAAVQPMLRTDDDWVHGMVAVTNALGWGVWRVHELTDDRIVVRIYDDYESAGYSAMYGQADRPVCYLHQGGVAGLMHLIRIGRIMDGPALDDALYARCFEAERPFVPRVTRSAAAGDDFTEIVAERA